MNNNLKHEFQDCSDVDMIVATLCTPPTPQKSPTSPSKSKIGSDDMWPNHNSILYTEFPKLEVVMNFKL